MSKRLTSFRFLFLFFASIIFTGFALIALPNWGSSFASIDPSEPARALVGLQRGDAPVAVLVVNPNNLQGWQTQVTTAATQSPTPSVLFEVGPPVPPLGLGSGELSVGANGNDAAQF